MCRCCTSAHFKGVQVSRSSVEVREGTQCMQPRTHNVTRTVLPCGCGSQDLTEIITLLLNLSERAPCQTGCTFALPRGHCCEPGESPVKISAFLQVPLVVGAREEEWGAQDTHTASTLPAAAVQDADTGTGASGKTRRRSRNSDSSSRRDQGEV